MTREKLIWRFDDPIVQELIKQVKIRVTGRFTERLSAKELMLLKSKLKFLGERALNEYFGHYEKRSENCRLSYLNGFAEYLGFADFNAFVEDFSQRHDKKPIEEKSSKFNNTLYSRRLTARAPTSEIISKLINSENLKQDVFEILSNLYSNLNIASEENFPFDFFTFDLNGENIEFAFCVFDFKYKPFSEEHLKVCRKVISEIKRLKTENPYFSIQFICNSLTNTPEYQTILPELAELQTEGICEIANFFDLRAFIAETLENIDIEIRNKILQSNEDFLSQFQTQMNQDFYIESIPFSNGIESSNLNPTKYISDKTVSEKEIFSELEYSIGKDTDPHFLKKKNWTLIISEFGFGKTSLLLNLFEVLSKHNILAIFLPISRIGKDAFNNTNQLCYEILRILYDDNIHILAGNFGKLMSIVFKRMMMRRSDVVLMFDGLDEHHHAYSGNQLSLIFMAIAKLRPECYFTLRKEFFDDKQGNFSSSLKGIENEKEIIQLSDWSDNQIIDFTDAYIRNRKTEVNKIEKLTDFIRLVTEKKYEYIYGDIPKRPLFLKMLISDIENNNIGTRKLSELYEQYLMNKFFRDRESLFSDNPRSPLRMESHEDRLKILGKIFQILEKAASMMYNISPENECIMLPSINESALEEESKSIGADLISISELLQNSILVPFRKRNINGLALKFAHKSFQEFFMARYVFNCMLNGKSDQVKPIIDSKYSHGLGVFLKGMVETSSCENAELIDF